LEARDLQKRRFGGGSVGIRVEDDQITPRAHQVPNVVESSAPGRTLTGDHPR
jgi:hypothetical protein